MTLEEDFIHCVIDSKEKQLYTANPQDANRLRAEIKLAHQILEDGERRVA